MEKDNKGECMWYQHVKMESVENDKKKQRKTLQHLHTNIPIVKGNIFYILHDNHNLLGTNI
jgi:hypothetical protein